MLVQYFCVFNSIIQRVRDSCSSHCPDEVRMMRVDFTVFCLITPLLIIPRSADEAINKVDTHQSVMEHPFSEKRIPMKTDCFALSRY